MAISGIICGTLNVTYHMTHTNEWSFKDLFGDFFKGFTFGAAIGSGFSGLGWLATKCALGKVLLGTACTGFGISGIIGAKKEYETGHSVWGTIDLAFSALSFYGAGNSFRGLFGKSGNITQNGKVEVEEIKENVKTNTFTFKESGNTIDMSNWDISENGSWLPDRGLGSKAPIQVTPGTDYLEGQYINNVGQIQPWKAYYDKWGQIMARTDYNAANIKEGIPAIHYHLYEWGPGKIAFKIADHIKGEFLR